MIKRMVQKVKWFFQDLWEKFIDGVAKFAGWCVRNKELAIILLTSIAGIAKHVTKIIAYKKEDEWRNRRFYDRRTDRWSYARKKLSKRQERIIERRYQEGETYRSILDDMGLLK